MTVEEACEYANANAGDGPGWNGRFRRALAEKGYVIQSWNDGQARPDYSLDAPLPFGTDKGWKTPSIIVEERMLDKSVPPQIDVRSRGATSGKK